MTKKAKSPPRACMCIDNLTEALEKHGHVSPEFDAIDTLTDLKTGTHRDALVLWYGFEKPAKRAGAKPKKARSYVVAKFCPMCGVALEGKSL